MTLDEAIEHYANRFGIKSVTDSVGNILYFTNRHNQILEKEPIIENIKSLYLDDPNPSNEDKPDMVNHPPHYKQHPSGVEVIEITEHMNFCLGNAVKYILRAEHKSNQIEDLKKAAWYINREIERLQMSE